MNRVRRPPRSTRTESAARASQSANGSGIGGALDPPRAVAHRNPVYPASLRGSGTAGQVLLEGIIDIDGSVRDLRVVEAAHPDFADSALDAVGEWRFLPTRLNGEPVETNMRVSLYYTVK